MHLKSFFLLRLFFIYAFTVNAQSAESIISKYIEFSGGEKQWKKIKSIVTSGKYFYGGMEFSFISYSRTPDLYKYIVSLNGKNYTQSYDGKNGWKKDEFNNETEPVVLTGKAGIAMANEADVELESPLIDYGKKGSRAVSEGRDTIQTTECFKIKFTRKGGERETYFFNTKNCELVMKSAVSKNAELQNAIIDTFYSDYRYVNGIKIPFKAVAKIKEQTILSVIIDKMEVNIPIPDNNFKP